MPFCLLETFRCVSPPPPPRPPASFVEFIHNVYTLPTTSPPPVRMWMMLLPSSPDEHQLEALKGLAHHVPASGISASCTRAATLPQYDQKLYAAGWSSLISLTFIDFCQKSGQIPVSCSANRPLDCYLHLRTRRWLYGWTDGPVAWVGGWWGGGSSLTFYTGVNRPRMRQ